MTRDASISQHAIEQAAKRWTLTPEAAREAIFTLLGNGRYSPGDRCAVYVRGCREIRVQQGVVVTAVLRRPRRTRKETP
jgi:hypothetical protein